MSECESDRTEGRGPLDRSGLGVGRETGGGQGGSGVQMVGQRWLVRTLVAGRCRVDWQIRRKKECCKLRSKMPRRKKAARFRHGHVPAPTRLGLDGAARRTKTPRGERTPASPSISMGDGAHGAVQGLVADADSSITHRATCTLPWVCMAVAASRDARVESMIIRRSGRCGNPSSTSFPLYI